jgi:tetratricopeptide (TPR) repeat protein
MIRRLLLLSTILGGLVIPQSGFAAEVTVPVRAGLHDRFNRMVLDWPTDVKYTMDQNSGHVSIQFTQAAKLSMGQFNAVAPPYIHNLQAQNNDSGLLVTFDVPDQARVQAFWAGKKVAFDVLLMSKDKPTFNAEPKPAEQSATPAAEETPPPAPVEPKLEPAPNAEEKPVEAVPETPPAAAMPPAEQRQETQGPQKPQALPTMPTLAEQMQLAEEAQQKKAATTLAEPAQAELKNETPVDEKGQKQEGTVIRFRLLSESKIAVFVRAGRLWAVIDQPMSGKPPQIQGDLQHDFENASRIETQNGTAYIFDLPGAMTSDQIAVRLDGLNWEIWFNNPQKQTPIAGSLTIKVKDEGKALVIDPDQETHVLPFDDKTVGDKIWVIPVLSPLLYSDKPQEMNSMSLAPTLVGGLLVPNQDALNVVAKGNTLVFQDTNSSLLLSSTVDRLQAEQKPEKQKLFHVDTKDAALIKGISQAHQENFEKRRQQLERQISFYKEPAERALRALDLVRLYLGQGFGPEAEGALDLAQQFLPNLDKTPDFMALRGMAYALSGKVTRALEMLNNPEVRDAPMAALWQAYAQAQNKNWENAFLVFKDMPDSFKLYPVRLRTRLLLAAAESAVETEHLKEAAAFLKQIDESDLAQNQKTAVAYINGVIELKDNADKGITELDAVTRTNDHYYRVKAELKVLDYETEDKAITIKEAIERLEKLRYAWRGDRQEVIILRQLGRYYIKSGQMMEAMTMWQQAIDRSENDKDEAGLQRDLQQVFNDVFAEGKTHKMTTVQILALYERFKKLMPEGEKGQRAGIQLADQLQKVDLVDQADKVLQDLLNNHATGADAVAVGTKLAAIRLIDRNPTGALKALDESENDAIPSTDMADRRKLLRIRALADSQQTDKALAMLADPNIPEGLSLRADLYWRLGRWTDAAYDLQTLIDSTEDKTAKNETYTGLILRMAIVKALQNDELGLAQMAAQYTNTMKDTKQAKAFAVMTAAGGDTALADLDTIKSQVAQVELFESFLKSF